MDLLDMQKLQRRFIVGQFQFVLVSPVNPNVWALPGSTKKLLQTATTHELIQWANSQKLPYRILESAPTRGRVH